MRANGIASVFVVDKGMRLLGIVTMEDTIAAVKDKTKLEDILKKDYFTASPEEYVQELISEASETKYPIAVVDEDNKLIGIIVRSSILSGLA